MGGCASPHCKGWFPQAHGPQNLHLVYLHIHICIYIHIHIYILWIYIYIIYITYLYIYTPMFVGRIHVLSTLQLIISPNFGESIGNMSYFFMAPLSKSKIMVGFTCDLHQNYHSPNLLGSKESPAWWLSGSVAGRDLLGLGLGEAKRMYMFMAIHSNFIWENVGNCGISIMYGYVVVI